MGAHISPPDLEQADAEEVVRAMLEHRKVDPEVAKRVEARAEEIRKKMPLLPAGTSVDLIRAGRDE